jgi:cytochrome c-type biogenesis protein
MDADQLQAAVQQASWASVVIGFTTGFLFSFNPVALASIPVSLAYVTKAREQRVAIGYAGAFVVGMLLVHALLGGIAALGGIGVQQLVGRYWGLVLGPLLIALGLVWGGWISLPMPQVAIRARRATTAWGAGALGAAFAVAVCPFCTPALVVLLGVAAGLGSIGFGVLLLLAFGVGRAIPVLLGGWAVGALEGVKPIAQYQRAFEVAGGIVLMSMGLYMLNAYFIWIPELAA